MAPLAMLGLAGVTAMEDSVGTAAVTAKLTLPDMPAEAALTEVDPAATPVTNPDVLTMAVDVLATVHVAEELMFAVEPSLYVAVAVNCCVAPTTMLAPVGVTAMEDSVLAAAVMVMEAMEVTEFTDAVMVDVPAATPVTMPEEFTVATPVLEDVQETPEIVEELVPLA